MDKRIAERQKELKKNADDSRKKRENLAVQIRKSARENVLSQKRQQLMNTNETESNVNTNQSKIVDKTVRSNISFNDDIDLIQSNCSDSQYRGVYNMRRVLSLEKDPPIGEVIESGAVPLLVWLLDSATRVDIKFETAWALTNIASGTSEQTSTIVNSGGVQVLVNHLHNKDSNVVEQCVWALGNIAGDCVEFRDLMVQCGVIPPLLKLFSNINYNKLNPRLLSLIKNTTWTLSNVCRGRPHVGAVHIIPIISPLVNLLNIDDPEVIADVCWALSYITDSGSDRVDAIMDTNCIPKIIPLLSHTSLQIKTPALRAVGNILSGNEDQTDAILNANALPRLVDMLSEYKRNIRKEACWALSNIAAGTRQQLDKLINSAAIPALVKVALEDEIEVRKEAVWALANALATGNADQVSKILPYEALRGLCNIIPFVENEYKMLSIILDAIECSLKVGQHIQKERSYVENPVTQMIDDADGVYMLEKLQESGDTSIYEKALQIIFEYFPHEEASNIDYSTLPNDPFGDNQPMNNDRFDFQM